MTLKQKCFYVGIFGWQEEGVGVSDVWWEFCKNFVSWKCKLSLEVFEEINFFTNFFQIRRTHRFVTSSLDKPPSFILIWIFLSSPKTPRLINETVESERHTKVHFISTRSSPDKNQRRQARERNFTSSLANAFEPSRLQPLPFSAVINRFLPFIVFSSQTEFLFKSSESQIFCVWRSFAFH